MLHVNDPIRRTRFLVFAIGVMFVVPVAAIAQKPEPRSRQRTSNCRQENGRKNSPPKLIGVELDETELRLPPRPGQTPLDGTPSADMKIGVNASGTDKDSDPIAYRYDVTGGTIIGEGPKVVWDLTDAAPGTYRLITSVTDGCDRDQKGAEIESIVTVSDTVPSCVLCDCPVISIDGPSLIDNTKVIVFVAQVAGGTQDLVTYTWKVTNGVIIDGQGTPALTVRMPERTLEKRSSVEVEIGGLVKECDCLTGASRIFENGIEVIERPQP